MKLFGGTSGFSYKEWKGPFYPERLPAGEMLGFYAGVLPAVEINNTFYRMPRASVLESWSSQVPDGFRFAIKASRRITHFKRLVDAADETDYLVKTTRALGEKLGVLLFQLPPNLKADSDRLEVFLDLLPDDVPAAFEFRHPSWREEPLRTSLRQRGQAFVDVDTEDAPCEEILGTGALGYFRLRRPDYVERDLERWAARISAEGFDTAFAFFKHEDEAAGPRMARSFLDIAERERRPRPVRRPARRERA